MRSRLGKNWYMKFCSNASISLEYTYIHKFQLKNTRSLVFSLQAVN